MSKKIQIDTDMFLNVCKLVLRLQDYHLDSNTKKLLERLETQINDKLEAMERRAIYTKYKTGVTDDEKEKARQEYLDLVNMRKSFRYKNENNNN